MLDGNGALSWGQALLANKCFAFSEWNHSESGWRSGQFAGLRKPVCENSWPLSLPSTMQTLPMNHPVQWVAPTQPRSKRYRVEVQLVWSIHIYRAGIPKFLTHVRLSGCKHQAGSMYWKNFTRERVTFQNPDILMGLGDLSKVAISVTNRLTQHVENRKKWYFEDGRLAKLSAMWSCHISCWPY